MAKQITTPPLHDEAMEKKMISLALKQAESQLKQGNASSQIVTHFLRLGSIRAEVELEKLRLESQLIKEKIESEKAGQQLQDMIGEVLSALKSYSPPQYGEDYDDIF